MWTSPLTPGSPGKVPRACLGKACSWSLTSLGSSSEPSPEAGGPPGCFSSFRAQNEYQDHLPGHPGGQEHPL